MGVDLRSWAKPLKERHESSEALLISVVMPTLNAAPHLRASFDALVAASLTGLVKEVIVVDGGSSDNTLKIADGFGARIATASPGRGGQLRKGVEAARGDWLLFLHGDTVLAPGWEEEAAAFVRDPRERAGVFTLQFDAEGLAPKIVASGAMLRTRILKLPYGDQGLLISRAVYDSVGGFADLPLMEDVEFIRRLIKAKGRGALHVFKASAMTSAERYERNGYVRQVWSNAGCLMRYFLGRSPASIAKEYSK